MVVIFSFGVRANCSGRHKGDREIQDTIYWSSTMYSIIISLVTGSERERGFGGRFRTWLQTLWSPVSERWCQLYVLFPWIWPDSWLLWLQSMIEIVLCFHCHIIKGHEVPAPLAGILIVRTMSHHVRSPRAQGHYAWCWEEAQTMWRGHEYILRSTVPSDPSFGSSQMNPRYHAAETTHSHCALSKLVTHRFCEHDKWVVFLYH